MISVSQTGFTISETLQTNVIVWIHSLPDPEMGPTRRMIEDVEGLIALGGYQLFQRRVTSKAELLAFLNELVDDAETGARPILHFDMHGTVDEGLLLAPSGERVSWAETVEALRKINIATQNNLVCIFALCFGLRSYLEVRLRHAVPAYFFCGPAAEIEVGVLEAQTIRFYREILESSTAWLDALAPILVVGLRRYHPILVDGVLHVDIMTGNIQIANTRRHTKPIAHEVLNFKTNDCLFDIIEFVDACTASANRVDNVINCIGDYRGKCRTDAFFPGQTLF